MLDFWGLADSGGTSPSRASQFPETVNSPGNTLFKYKLTNPEHTPDHLLHKVLYAPVIFTPGPVTRQLGAALGPLGPSGFT